MMPTALGSDTGGSIRLPAAFCGVVGLKPTYGRVPKRGVLPLSWTLDTCGPLSRSVEDAALTLQVIAGHDPDDPSSALEPVPDFSAELELGLRGMRIGLAKHFYERDSSASVDCIEAMNQTIEVLRSLGAEVVEVELPSLHDYQACNRTITLSEAFSIHRDDLLSRPQDYAAITRYRLLPGALLRASDYANALRFQRQLCQITLEAMRDLDVLMAPTTFGPAPVQATMRAEANFSNPPLTNPFNVVPLPTVCLCNGFSSDGMPLSVQFAGHPFQEARVLRIARAYEQAVNWRDRRPSLLEPDLPVAPIEVGASMDSIDTKALEDASRRARAAGYDFEPQQLANLAEVLPHLDAMVARIPGARDYDRTPEHGDAMVNLDILAGFNTQASQSAPNHCYCCAKLKRIERIERIRIERIKSI